MAADPTSLDALVDIVTPPAAPWWPPAPGWYVVIGAAVAAAEWAALRALQKWQANAYRRAALTEVDRIATAAENDADAWSELPEIVKRTALSAWPRSRVAALTGEEWLAFLDQSGGSTDFSHGAGRWLVELAYNPQAARTISRDQSGALLTAVRRWIGQHFVLRTEAEPC